MKPEPVRTEDGEMYRCSGCHQVWKWKGTAAQCCLPPKKPNPPKIKPPKTKQPLEKDIEKKVCDWAKQQGCLVYKFTSPSQRSVPDRMFVLPFGTVVFIEFKAPGKLPTELQQKELNKLVSHSVMATWFDNEARAVSWLDDRIHEDMTKLL